MKEKEWKVAGSIVLWGILLFLVPTLSSAQQYPTKPINILIGYASGGAVDPSLRAVAAGTEKFLGQPLVLSNRGGGGGSIALGIVAKERPDGYHLVCASSTGFVYVPQFQKVLYELKDFEPILTYAKGDNGLIVKSTSPWKTLKELVEYAKKNPGAVNYGTIGTGSPAHLAMQYIAKQEKIQWTHVPFKGSGPGFLALLGGHITAQSGGFQEIHSYVKEGSVRVLANYGEKRWEKLPNVPTLPELGYDFTADISFIVAAPKGTPPAIVKTLEESFRKGMDDPQFIQTIDKLGIDIVYRSSADTKKYLEEAYARLGQLINDLKTANEPGNK
jgi:tripartite-type tricarboxylate transporter receptor subunit TctC